jgi:hypothetical protein
MLRFVGPHKTKYEKKIPHKTKYDKKIPHKTKYEQKNTLQN